MECNICSQNHEELHRTGLLNMRGSEDDYICNTCKSLIAKFARSLKTIADLVRYAEKEKK
jgi:protein-arginine kinase activator protein McsA